MSSLATPHLVLINSESDFAMTALSRIAHDIHDEWTPDQTLKKYQVLKTQLHSRLLSNERTASDRFLTLRHFFFEEKKFCVLVSKPTLYKSLLPYTLLSRSGSTDILLLLFISLAKSLEIPLEVLNNPQTTTLKWLDAGRARLFFFEQKARELSKQDILDLVNEGVDCTETLCVEDIFARYLNVLKTQSLRERSLLHFYKLQTHLIHYQPFALHHLVDRARVAYAIGDIVRAAEDLGQYVTFHSEKVTNNRYLNLLKKLRMRK